MRVKSFVFVLLTGQNKQLLNCNQIFNVSVILVTKLQTSYVCWFKVDACLMAGFSDYNIGKFNQEISCFLFVCFFSGTSEDATPGKQTVQHNLTH